MKRRNILLFTFFLLIIVACSSGPSSPTPLPVVPRPTLTPRPIPTRIPPIINLQIESVRLLEESGDMLDETAELQLFVVLSDGIDSVKLAYPSEGYYELSPGHDLPFETIGKFPMAFDEGLVEGDVFVYFLAVDSDDLEFFGVDASEFVGTLISIGVKSYLAPAQAVFEAVEVVKDVVDDGASSTDSSSSNSASTDRTKLSQSSQKANFLFGMAPLVGELLINWAEQNDVLGEAMIRLSRENDWGTGAYTFQTDNGNLEIDFNIVRSQDAPVNSLLGQVRSGTVPSLDNLLPNQADIPTDLELVETGANSNEDIAEQYDNSAELLRQLNEWGRITSLTHYYENKQGCDTQEGILDIFLQAILYETQVGVKQGFEWASNRNINSPAFESSEPASLGRDGLIVWHNISACDSSLNSRRVIIGFYDYNVLGWITVSGISGTITDSQLESLALELAQIIGANIRQSAQ